MTNHDVAVATPSDDTNTERPDRSLAEQLVEQARADGKDLVGPGGLLSDLTKQVLDTGLEVEMEEHLGYPKHAAAAPLWPARTRSKYCRFVVDGILL